MKLPFEEWVEKQEISNEAKELFSEAIKCYKISAYRGSLLISYLGFQSIIKERVLSSQKPDDITEDLWENIHRKLLNDDAWDQMVYETIQRKHPREVFILNDDIRNQITYWKNRRNDCAHSKNNEISYTHVENFWLFIQSNHSKFMVNGSKEALLNKIKIHFDVSLTPPNKDVSPIINEIQYAVSISEMETFFKNINEYIKDIDNPFTDMYYRQLSFWDDIFNLANEKVVEQLTKFLLSNRSLILTYLRRFPSKIVY